MDIIFHVFDVIKSMDYTINQSEYSKKNKANSWQLMQNY